MQEVARWGLGWGGGNKINPLYVEYLILHLMLTCTQICSERIIWVIMSNVYSNATILHSTLYVYTYMLTL